MSGSLTQAQAVVLLNDAEQLIEHRSVAGHVYTSSKELDDELHAWFRGRWQLLNVNDPSACERQLKDTDWWRAFNQHFESRVPNITQACILQRDMSKPLGAQGNFCFVTRGVRLVVEICRSRER